MLMLLKGKSYDQNRVYLPLKKVTLKNQSWFDAS